MPLNPYTAGDEHETLASINTTPLVDVMLVLLIIFLITIPVVTTSVPVDLPKENTALRQSKPNNVVVSVDKAGHIFLYDTLMKDATELQQRLKKMADMQPPPEVQIRGDGAASFEAVARVMTAAQGAGIKQIGFITEPQD